MVNCLLAVSIVQIVYAVFSILVVGLVMGYAIWGGERFRPPNPPEPDEEKYQRIKEAPEKPAGGGKDKSNASTS